MLRLYIYVIMRLYLYMLCGAMLALASCTNDTLQEMKPDYTGKPETSAMPDGTYLVDYTVDNGASTRAGGKLPVSSLDYYVYYEEGGVLLKHRRISIPANQQWPLTRDNMTWEQRQALQDTLICGVDYRILFIANVDSALFNYDGYSAENPHPAVVKGDTLYQNARILLPNVPFHDDNMYCLWEGALNCTESKGVVNRNDIMLQRIVTRTDVSRTENPTDLYTAIENGFYETNCRENVENAVSKWIDDFCGKIKECASSYHVSFKVTIDKYEDKILGLTKLITDCKDLIKVGCGRQLIDRYVYTIKNSAIYNTRLGVWYQTGRTARVSYSNATRANAIGFDRISYYDVFNGDEALCGEVRPDGKVCIIGFAGSGDCNNTVTALHFYDALDSPTFSISGTGASFSVTQGINYWYDIECDPISFVNFVSSTGFSQMTTFDLDAIMKNGEKKDDWNTYMNDKDLMEAINTDFFGEDCVQGHNGGKDYFEGYSFTNFPIHVSLPDITSENVDDGRIELIPSWSDPKQVVEE